jgi:hypothetical protein
VVIIRKLIGILLIIIFLVGCGEVNVNSVDNIGDIDELMEFLPDYPYIWEYEGTGSYYHIMSIDKIDVFKDEVNYKITGEVISEKNASSFDDYLFSIRYIVNNKGIRQEKNEKKMIDSKYDSLYLLKFPIEKDNIWTEKVVDNEGNKGVIEATITNVDFENGKKIITVKYNEKNSDYYEIRRIMEKKGIISFEKEINYEKNSYNFGYVLKDRNNDLNQVQDDFKLHIEMFLNKFNIAWQNYFNTNNDEIFKMILKDSDLNEIFNKMELSKIKIEFKELTIIEISKKNDKYYVNVNEKYLKKLGDEEQIDEAITEYIIVQENGEYFIENYINHEK